jgi:DNA-binding transcriptional MerR regulator
VTTHTIGEVLNRLKGEFEDITISKIRFLEAEGLISPDRTESGYRKFTPADIDRLRYVLRAQRDRYLPLKVIKDELARLDAGLPVDAGTGAVGSGNGSGTAAAGQDDVAGTEPAGDRPRLLDANPTDVQLSRAELAASCGLEDADLAALRDHGLLGDGPTHDADDLTVAKLASALLRSGLEVRHLRMYRQFAEREAALAEAMVAPLLRQRNPASRKAAADHAEHLALVGGQLHRALLAKQLRDVLRS